MAFGHGERVRRVATVERAARPENRIDFAGEAVEVRVHRPGTLHELELPRDVCVEAEEINPAWFRRCGRRLQRTRFDILVWDFPIGSGSDMGFAPVFDNTGNRVRSRVSCLPDIAF